MSEAVKKILATLMIYGAQTAEKAVKTEDLAVSCNLDPNTLETEVEKLIRSGHIKTHTRDETIYLYLTPTGIVAASSIYS